MAVSRDHATQITRLEGKLEANRWFPGAARLASYYQEAGDTQKAIELCLTGLVKFPNYATMRLVLAKCYEAQGRSVEAMLEYRRVLKAVPDNPTVLGLLKNIEQKEQEAFKVFAEERSRKLKDRKDSLTFEKYIADKSSEKESTVDFLLQRLQEAKAKPQPPRERATLEEAPPVPAGANKIVTATLAEIYANQGEYKEAIEAYKKLVEHRPQEAERFERRIVQLEELARLHQNDPKQPSE
jgi:tetratricopeptide (TPR) repeat protein